MSARNNFTDRQKQHVQGLEKVIGKNAADRLGTFKEAPGGGTPLKSGQKAPSKEWVAEHRVMQPRDEDGKFTYNSANLKDLKYQPSRGKTIPPFLKGVRLTFTKKKIGKYTVSGKDVYSVDIKMTPEEFLKSMQQYYNNNDEGFKGMQTSAEGNHTKKRGRRSQYEKDMINKGEEGFASTKDFESVDLGQFGTIESFSNALNHYKQKPNPSGNNGKNKFASKRGKGNNNNTGNNNTGNNNAGNNNAGNNNSSKKPSGNNNGGNQNSKTPQQNSSAFSDDDIKMASSDPQGFITKHKDKLNELSQLAKSKGKGFNVGKVISLIAQHGNAAYDAIKKQLNS